MSEYNPGEEGSPPEPVRRLMRVPPGRDLQGIREQPQERTESHSSSVGAQGQSSTFNRAGTLRG